MTAAELKKQFQSRGLEFKDYGGHSHFGQWEKADTNQPVLIMAENISELGPAITRVCGYRSRFNKNIDSIIHMRYNN